MAPFLWMGFNCLKAAEPLLGENLLFIPKSAGVAGTRLIPGTGYPLILNIIK